MSHTRINGDSRSSPGVSCFGSVISDVISIHVVDGSEVDVLEQSHDVRLAGTLEPQVSITIMNCSPQVADRLLVSET